MLRTSFFAEIEKIVSESNYFDVNDFRIESLKTNKESQYVLKITYKFKESYLFKAWIPNQKTSEKDGYQKEFRISILFSPGELSEDEEKTCAGKTELLLEIKSWINRVKEDLLATPLFRKVQEQKEQLDKFMEEFIEFDEKYFSNEEAEILRQKLEELEKRLTLNIQESSLKSNEQEEKINKIHEEIEVLKQKIDSHSKKGWAGVLMNKSLDWLKEPLNRKIIKSGVEVAAGMLSDGIEKGNEVVEQIDKMIGQ